MNDQLDIQTTIQLDIGGHHYSECLLNLPLKFPIVIRERICFEWPLDIQRRHWENDCEYIDCKHPGEPTACYWRVKRFWVTSSTFSSTFSATLSTRFWMIKT